MKMLKTLVFDIETWPIIADVWALKDQNIGLNQIVQDKSVMAWGAKWLDSPASEVMYEDVRKQKDLRDDSKILKGIWKLLDETDIVITQNGQSFDSPVLNARFIMNGMKPPSPYVHLDTYRIVKRVMHFTSNKLEYLTDKLCTKYKKASHGKYPGMSLWNECGKGNLVAWEEMKKYNILDVLSTEELYNKIKGWVPSLMQTPHAEINNRGKCGSCGELRVVKGGPRMRRTGLYQTYVCRGCGRWTTGEKIK